MIDLLIIGSGGAGLTTAIEAKRNNAKVTVLSKTTITASQTCQAQGGINACLDTTNDSIQNHIDDTIKAANGLGDINTIELLCKNAPDAIRWLDNIAVPFSRDQNGNIAQRKLGGTSNARACYSSDYTGLKILNSLYDTCIKEQIDFLEEYMLLDIVTENNIAKGIIALDIKNGTVQQILAKRVVLATGGYAGIYTNYNTNSYATTGDGIAIALQVGCKVSNMEYIQFHPTALTTSSILISESARGEGGYLVTKDGTRFTNELEARDIVAREIYKKLQENQTVYLDLRHLGKEKILSTMPQEYNLCLQYNNLHMDKDLIPISPVAHYSMGGIKTNQNGETNIKNLYAVGECSNNGSHGANRLGGNSLLEIIVFGKLVGKVVSEDLDQISVEEKLYKEFNDQEVKYNNLYKLKPQLNFYMYKTKIGNILYDKVGLFRTNDELVVALNELKDIQLKIKDMGIEDKSKVYNTNLKEFYEFKNILTLAIQVTQSALTRRECRGAHFREDYRDEVQ